MEKTTLSYSIIPAWVVIETLENKIKKILKNEDNELYDAVTMTISELIENAVKYEKATEALQAINIRFSIEDDQITIIVSNPASDKNHVKILDEHINKIINAKDRRQLFTEKLRGLLENEQSGKSQLGLYRIAYEGKFNLSYTYENDIITVIATRGKEVTQEQNYAKL